MPEARLARTRAAYEHDVKMGEQRLSEWLAKHPSFALTDSTKTEMVPAGATVFVDSHGFHWTMK